MKTLVIGASSNPERYSNMAVRRLKKHSHEVLALGRRNGEIDSVPIDTGMPQYKDLDTITVYMNAQNQKPLEDYMLSLNPRRIIFNPGAENPSLEKRAEEKGIEVVEACTLVMLSIGSY